MASPIICFILPLMPRQDLRILLENRQVSFMATNRRHESLCQKQNASSHMAEQALGFNSCEDLAFESHGGNRTSLVRCYIYKDLKSWLRNFNIRRPESFFNRCQLGCPYFVPEKRILLISLDRLFCYGIRE